MVVACETITNAVVFVHHRGDAVVAKAINIILSHEIGDVRQKETKCLIVRVAEYTTIPKCV